MKPFYLSSFVVDKDVVFQHLLNDLQWLEATNARKEYFMAFDKLTYNYGSGNNVRAYQSESFSQPVQAIMEQLNQTYQCDYNVCFLNRYDDAKKQLGWHADNSSEMNTEHPIAVISFGAEREIWWKKQDYKGEVPKDNRQILHHGSLFVMPAHFQEEHFHKIPRCDKECGIRISLTFRNYLNI